MIKAAELRIGNFLHGDNDPDMYVVSIDANSGVEMGFLGMSLDEANDYGLWHYDFSDLKPIPLTEEWLVKFGYEDKNKHNFFGTLGLLISNKHYYVSFTSENGVCIFQKHEIKSVHQLQNLYFALTGEELIYKP